MMMMKACPKLSEQCFWVYTHLFSALLSRLPVPCGFAASAEARLLSVTFRRNLQVDFPPVLPKYHRFQAFHTARTILSYLSLTPTSAESLKRSLGSANPKEHSNLSYEGLYVTVQSRKCQHVQNGHLEQRCYMHNLCKLIRDTDEQSSGLHISVGSRKSQALQYGCLYQGRYTHNVCKLIRDTDEELESSGSLRLFESNGENLETCGGNEASSSNSEDVSCTEPGQGKESHEKVRFYKPIKKFRRFKIDPEGTEIRLKLDLCSKLADLHGALDVFDQVKREQKVKLDVYKYNILLYLCSGAASGSLFKDCRVRKKKLKAAPPQPLQDDHNDNKSSEGPEPVQGDHNDKKSSQDLEDSTSLKVLVHFSSEDIKLALAKGADILEDMLNQGVEPNEATYTSIIRLAVARNDGDLAFETIKIMESSGIPPRLRSYGPLFTCFSASKNADKAYEVDDHMTSIGVQPDENMLDTLLRLSTYSGREDKVYSLLHRLRKSVRDLLPTTVNSIEQWFTSKDAAFAGEEKLKSSPLIEQLRKATVTCGGGYHGLGWLGTGVWQVRRTSISKTGLCLSCGETLSAVDLDVKDTQDFGNCIARLACEKQKCPNDFKIFQEWLAKHGPFDAIIDGANVGFYNPRIFQGFNMGLLNGVVNAAAQRFCTQKLPLVIIHSRHKHEICQDPKSEAILKRWKQHRTLYFTPPGANDDWFWLYAAVKYKCMLVTNDMMRDHIFELLGNNFFPKWKEKHQVHFSFTGKGLEIHMPPPYSTIIQESMKGSWHIPQVGEEDSEVSREWLCVTRASPTSGA